MAGVLQSGRSSRTCSIHTFVSVPAGHHTLTFKVLRQSEDLEEYLEMGAVEIFGPELKFLEPFSIELKQ